MTGWRYEEKTEPLCGPPAARVSALCGGGGFPLRRVTHCPTCGRRRRFAGLDGGPWYGVNWTCCACGDAWCEGERLPRPFQPGWRAASAAGARRVWAAARPRAEHRAWLTAQLEGTSQ